MVILVIIICIVVVIIFIAALSKSDNGDKHVDSGYNKSSSSVKYVSYEKPVDYHIYDDDALTVVGGFYRDWVSRDFINNLQPGDEVFFLAEPGNEYDRNAVMVISVTGLHLGYVPRSMAKSFKYRLIDNKLKGVVLGFPDNFQFRVRVFPVDDINHYNKAVSSYLHSKETIVKETINIQKNQFYSDLISQAVMRYKRQQFSKVIEILKPMIDEDAKSFSMLRLLIYTYHSSCDYKNESVCLDKILALQNIENKDYFERRKYHVLRVLGCIVSNEQIENVKEGVETTVLELDFFHRIVKILSDKVDPNRIDFRDSKGLFAVNLDSNIRRPICKLYLNNPDKMFIGIMNDDNSILKIPISSIDELNSIKEELYNPIEKYLKDDNLFY